MSEYDADDASGAVVGLGGVVEVGRAGDEADAEHLYSLLEGPVAQTFADDAAWATASRRAMSTCAPVFNTHRMVDEYFQVIYAPAGRASEAAAR